MTSLLHPEKIFDDLEIMPAMRVADFGAGRSGHLVFPLARRVGERGKVFAVDVLPEALEMIEGRRRQYLLHNLETVWGDLETEGSVGIEGESLDVAFLVHAFWKMKDGMTAVKEVGRLLKPEGRIAVIDWLPNTLHPIGRRQEKRLHPNAVDVYFLTNDFSVSQDFRPSPWHWGRVYVRV